MRVLKYYVDNKELLGTLKLDNRDNQLQSQELPCRIS